MRCDECRMWYDLESTEQGDDGHESGECRRHAPVSYCISDRESGENNLKAIWPLTLHDEWCGEFQAKENELTDLYARHISVLNPSMRVRNACAEMGILTIGDMCRRTYYDFEGCRNFGVTALSEVREKLRKLGLCLKGEVVD